jgi:CheY-like chemotaxis protein
MSDLGAVLVVEDEFLIRTHAVFIFEEAGYTVLEASNADEAIKILESRNDIFLIFTDIDMPGSMDGLKLAWAVHDRWPPIRIVVTSGLVSPSEWQLPSGGHLVPKPYSKADIASALSRLAH